MDEKSKGPEAKPPKDQAPKDQPPKTEGKPAPRNEDAVRALEEELAAAHKDRAGAVRALEEELAAAYKVIDDREATCKTLAGDRDSLRTKLAELLTKLHVEHGTAPAADIEVPRDHVPVYTLYTYVVEGRSGGRFAPKSIPPGKLIAVPRSEYELDQLRRFPHLQDRRSYEERKAAEAQRRATPTTQLMGELVNHFALADEMAKVREQQRQVTIAQITDPTRIAAQLPG